LKIGNPDGAFMVCVSARLRAQAIDRRERGRANGTRPQNNVE
jgi:hypothetical protein